MTTAMFVVCWVLIHQPVANQENCTPAMGYSVAHSVMTQVVATADILNISMSLAPRNTAAMPQVKAEDRCVTTEVVHDAFHGLEIRCMVQLSSKAEEKDR